MAAVQDVWVKLTKLDGNKVRIRTEHVSIMERVSPPTGSPEGAPDPCTRIDFQGSSEQMVYVEETIDEIAVLEAAAAS